MLFRAVNSKVPIAAMLTSQLALRWGGNGTAQRQDGLLNRFSPARPVSIAGWPGHRPAAARDRSSDRDLVIHYQVGLREVSWAACCLARSIALPDTCRKVRTRTSLGPCAFSRLFASCSYRRAASS